MKKTLLFISLFFYTPIQANYLKSLKDLKFLPKYFFNIYHIDIPSEENVSENLKPVVRKFRDLYNLP